MEELKQQMALSEKGVHPPNCNLLEKMMNSTKKRCKLWTVVDHWLPWQASHESWLCKKEDVSYFVFHQTQKGLKADAWFYPGKLGHTMRHHLKWTAESLEQNRRVATENVWTPHFHIQNLQWGSCDQYQHKLWLAIPICEPWRWNMNPNICL